MKKKYVVLLLIIYSSCINGQTNQSYMDSQREAKLLKIIQSSDEQLLNRIKALKEIGLNGEYATISGLKKILKRDSPDSISAINWDPIADERVVDLYILQALHELKDDSEINIIAVLVSKAGRVLEGPEDELVNACQVIQSIGLKEPIEQIVNLINNNNFEVVRNAVVLLNLLDLPSAPIGGNTSSILPSNQYTFQFNRLQQEMELLVSFSKGKIQLSNGVKEFVKMNDFDRGNVKIENRTLQERVEQDLSILDLDYYIENKVVVICTHQEAGKRWKTWWLKHSDSLSYK